MIYLSATDHINKHPYCVHAPAYIQSIHKPIIAGDLFAPIYETFDTNQQQRMMIPIAKMVELSISNTIFTIIDDYDVLLILHQIDAYVKEVYQLISDKQVSSYVDRILKLRIRIYTLFRRVLNRRPDWKKAYGHGKNLFGMIEQLYQGLGITMNTPSAPLDELAMCPTVRAHSDQFKQILRPAVMSELGDKINYNV
jgi:hypothetical protein